MYVSIEYELRYQTYVMLKLSNLGFEKDATKGNEILDFAQVLIFGVLPEDNFAEASAFHGITFVKIADPPPDGDNKSQDTPV